MPEVVDSSAFESSPRRSRYAYLLDGQVYRLRRGVDFPETLSFTDLRGRLSYLAARHGLRQRTKREDDDTILVQLFKQPTNGNGGHP